MVHKRRGGSTFPTRLLLVGAFTLPVFALVVAVTWAAVFRTVSPALALTLAPFDGEARAARAMTLVTAQPRSPAARATAARLAEEAVARSPLSVAGYRVMALTADLQGKPAQAAKLFAASDRVSRRDLPTRLWLIESAVARNDIPTALRHYDTALKTSQSSRSLLFPVLMTAASDPEIRAPLARMLRQDALWTEEFAEELVARGKDFDSVVYLTRGRFDPRDELGKQSLNTMLARLTDAKRFDLAWTVYADARQRLTGRRPSPDGVREPAFEGNGVGIFPPFDWILVDEGDLAAVRRPREGGTGNALYLTARNGMSGDVARQLVRLAPGRNRLRFLAGNVSGPLLDRPSVVLTCAAGGAALANIYAQPAGPAGVDQGIDFLVPQTGCGWQWLSIRANGQGEAEPWIDQLRLGPVTG